MKRGKSRSKIFSAVFVVILLLTLVLSMASVVSAQFWTEDNNRDWRSLTPTKIVCESPLGNSDYEDCCGRYAELCVKNPSISIYETNPEAKRAYDDLVKCYQENGITVACNIWPYQRSRELSPGAGQLQEDTDFCYDKCGAGAEKFSNMDDREKCRVSCLHSIGYTEHQWAFEELSKAIDDARSDYAMAPKKTSSDSGEASKQAETAQEQGTSLTEEASSFSAEEDKSLADNQFFNQLKAALSGKESLSSEQVANAVKAYRAKINADQGKKISVNLPKDSPIQNIVAITARPLQDATMTVTIIDEVNLNKAVPLLGGRGIIGNPDYAIPRLPLGPPPNDKFDIREYFKVDTQMPKDEGSLPYYKEAFFNFVTGGTVDEAARTKILHYDESKKDWVPLPTQYSLVHDAYGGKYRFTSHTPSFSFFAIVVEKQKSSSALGWITFAIILIEAVVIILAYILLRRKANNLNKKDKPEGRGTASLVLGIIGIILFLFPYVGFLLAGLALVFAKIQKTIKPTGLSTAGFVLGIIGVCLNVIVSISIMLYAFF